MTRKHRFLTHHLWNAFAGLSEAERTKLGSRGAKADDAASRVLLKQILLIDCSDFPRSGSQKNLEFQMVAHTVLRRIWGDCSQCSC